MATYRLARAADIPVLMEIRNNVRENRLVNTVLSTQDYAQALMVDGRGWVCEVDDTVVGFACGRRIQGDVWALFVRQAHEGKGIGGQLMDRVEAWMRREATGMIWLVTSPGTRAERLYRRRGWADRGTTATGEVRFELPRQPIP
ncbi:MAG: GNAT family N-acetyltransferase [Myxococcota bacterium]